MADKSVYPTGKTIALRLISYNPVHVERKMRGFVEMKSRNYESGGLTLRAASGRPSIGNLRIKFSKVRKRRRDALIAFPTFGNVEQNFSNVWKNIFQPLEERSGNFPMLGTKGLRITSQHSTFAQQA